MNTIAQRRNALRALLPVRPAGAAVSVPGAGSPLVARQIAAAGFPAVFLTGAGAAATVYGLADVGVMTATELIGLARSLARSVDVPVLVDCDTGYGNELNALHTVAELAESMVAGVTIEDQTFPKRCGALQEKSVVPVTEMVSKIRAVVTVAQDSGMVVVARSDALAVEGVASTIDRCMQYVEAGADAIFVDQLTTVDVVEKVAAKVHAPLIFNMSTSGKVPWLTVDEIGAHGYSMCLLPNWTTLAAIRAVDDVLMRLRRTGDARSVLEQCASFDRFMELAGLLQTQQLAEGFAASGGFA